MVHPTQTETRLDSPATCRNHCDTEDTCRSLPSPSPLGTTRRNPPDVHRKWNHTGFNQTPSSSSLDSTSWESIIGQSRSYLKTASHQTTHKSTHLLDRILRPYNAMQTRSKAEPHRSTKSPEIKTSTINPLWPTYNMRHQYQIERQSIGWSTNS